MARQISTKRTQAKELLRMANLGGRIQWAETREKGRGARQPLLYTESGKHWKTTRQS